MKNEKKYLTMEEKKELFFKGKTVPICVGKNSQKNTFIAKLRGTIFDGSLKNKRISL